MGKHFGDGESCPGLPPLPPLEGLSLGELFDVEVLKPAAIQAGTTTAGILGLSLLSEKLFQDKTWGGYVKSGAAVALSLLGAILLWNKQEDVARGLVGISGFALADLVANAAFKGVPSIYNGLPVGQPAPAAVAGYEEYLGNAGYRAALSAVNETSTLEATIETEQRGGDFAAVDIEEDLQLRGLVGSLG